MVVVEKSIEQQFYMQKWLLMLEENMRAEKRGQAYRKAMVTEKSRKVSQNVQYVKPGGRLVMRNKTASGFTNKISGYSWHIFSSPY